MVMNPFKTAHDKVTRNIRIIKKGFSSVTILPRFAHFHSQPFRDGRVGYFSLLEECSEHQEFYLQENYLPLYFEVIFVECIGVPFGLNFVSEIEFKDIVENSLEKLDSVREKYRDEVTKNDNLHFRLRVARIHLQTAIVHVLQRQSFVDLRRTLAADLLSEADAIMDELTRSERRRLSQNNQQVIEIFVKLMKIDLIHFCLDSFPREKRRLLLLEAQNCVEDITAHKRMEIELFSRHALDLKRMRLRFLEATLERRDEATLLALAAELESLSIGRNKLSQLSNHERLDMLVGVYNHLSDVSSDRRTYLEKAESCLISLSDLQSYSPQASCRTASSLANLRIRMGKFQEAFNSLEPFLNDPLAWLQDLRKAEDVEHYATLISDFGAMAAHCKIHLDDAAGALACLEAGSSILKKLRASESPLRDAPAPPISLSHVGFNPQILERTNIRLGLTRFGLSLVCFRIINGEPFTCGKVVHEFDSSRFIFHVLEDIEFPIHARNYKESLAVDNGVQWEHLQDSWDHLIVSLLEYCWAHIGTHISDFLHECGVEKDSWVHLICPSSVASFPIPNCGIQQNDGSWRCLNDDWYISMSEFGGHQQFVPKIDPSLQPRTRGWVIDPRLDLAVLPAIVAEEFGEDAIVLWGAEADRSAVLQLASACGFVGFISHCEWVVFDQRGSGLLLAGDDVLGASDLDTGTFANGPDIFLGSCESALGDLLYQPNESRGLSDSLLWAGASTVTASHWPIAVDTAICYGKIVANGAKGSGAMETIRAVTQYQRTARAGSVFPDVSGNEQAHSAHFDGVSRPSVWAAYSIVSR